MTAKEYLLQVKSKYKQIQEQEDYVQRLKDSLDVKAIRYDKEPMSGTPDPYSREHLFIKLIEEEDKLTLMYKEYLNFRIKVIDRIHSLDDYRHRKILYGVYIDFENLKDLKIGYSYDYIRELHVEALKAFSEKFPHDTL